MRLIAVAVILCVFDGGLRAEGAAEDERFRNLFECRKKNNER